MASVDLVLGEHSAFLLAYRSRSRRGLIIWMRAHQVPAGPLNAVVPLFHFNGVPI
jgi:hypothetical protein